MDGEGTSNQAFPTRMVGADVNGWIRRAERLRPRWVRDAR